MSPAQGLTEATTQILFVGLVPGHLAIIAIATLECFIGLCLLLNRWMRLAVWLLAIEFVGILSPLILLPGRLFSGPHHAPTLEGQYVLKDVILVAAALVVAATAFRGGRLVRGDLPPAAAKPTGATMSPEEQLQIVLDGREDAQRIARICDNRHISESEFYAWHDATVAGATQALSELQVSLLVPLPEERAEAVEVG